MIERQKTAAEIVAEALGRPRPTGRDAWMDDLEGGNNHTAETPTGDSPAGDDPALEERISTLRAKATELGINRKRNNR